ncbi:metal-dependent hydrolase [Pleurocapsales cyanobacterium LEGE 06147]|nr:metal-dependent hydrolase [Pleurocapsales cyanobacterium LEGE 06147]
MPSPIAHSVSGYVLAKFLPLKQTSKSNTRYWLIFYPVFVAIFADFDFFLQLITGEKYHRGFTHSLVFTLIFSIVFGLIISYFIKYSYQQIFWSNLIIYFSHLVLDFFTAGGNGMELLWPFFNNFFKSPISIFPSVNHSRGLWDYSHLITITFELSYSILLLWLVSLSNNYKKIIKNIYKNELQ